MQVGRFRTWRVPGQRRWLAWTVRRDGRTVAVRARHLLAPWRVVTVPETDLRYGAERIARELRWGTSRGAQAHAVAHGHATARDAMPQRITPVWPSE